jgi:hypothetical protein
MYCSTKKFIDIATKTWVESKDLHALLVVVQWLHARRWSLIKSTKFQAVLGEKFPQATKMIQLLVSVDKLSSLGLKSLVSELDSSWTSSFTIIWSDHASIEKTLQKKFGDHDVQHIASSNTSVQISWNGRWYKRSLDKDLDKVLN